LHCVKFQPSEVVVVRPFGLFVNDVNLICLELPRIVSVGLVGGRRLVEMHEALE
jgi:hypothetical protein